MEAEKVYRLWQREMMKFFRERSRIITSVVSPLLWIMIFGSGLSGKGGDSGAGAVAPGGIDYRVFIFPGILGMSLLFTGMFAGISVIWDRQFGFLKAILASPVKRSSIILGKAIGGATASMIQGTILLCFAPLAGARLTIPMAIEVLPVMFLISMGIVCIGLLIAAFMESMEGFNMIMSFAIMPMFFLSGALYPLSTAPNWLRAASCFDPLTYGVDALRTIMLPGWRSMFSVTFDVALLATFSTVTILLASMAFSRKK